MSTPGRPAPAAPPIEPLRRPRSGVALVPGQIRYQLLLLVRNPMAPFISVVMPLMLLVALDLVTPEMTLASLGHETIAQFLTPAMTSFAVINAGFVNIVIGMTLGRELGILKRLRNTPLPSWAYLAGRLAAAAIVAAIASAMVIGVGIVFLHAHLETSALPGLLATLALGFVTSCALGMAASGFVRSAEAALPLAYAVLLPVAFVSQVFFPSPSEAEWLRHVADALPVAPFASAMQKAFLPGAHGLSGGQAAVLLAWAGGGLVLAVINYRWEPRRDRASRR